MSVTQEIKSRLDIVDVVSDHVSLRKSGRSYAGFCPFHPNTRTPAFHVFPETQTWYCFGACAEGGDLFSFVMKKEGWDFKEALVNMAERAGVKLEDYQSTESSKEAADDRLLELIAAAADYFHQLLKHAPQAEAARQYLNERELSDDTQATFLLGYALDSWDACRTHFNSQGYTDDDLLEAGLLSEKPEKGTRYDRFRNRLMIPIRNVSGRVVGFGARTLEKDGIPKYLNSPQTTNFNKSHLLFGLDLARPYIREARRAVIVEGYMDVMQGYQAGYRNLVAQMGTALTEAQLRQLKRYTKRFILALDADSAGLNATMRGLEVARHTLDREVEVRFDSRGLVRHEGRLQADIRVVTLPTGTDPDKLIREEPGRWPNIIDEAKPVVEYVIDVVTKELDLSDAKEKAAAGHRVVPLIRDIADPIERDHYWQLLARALQVDERALRQMRPPGTGPQQPALSGSFAQAPLPSGEGLIQKLTTLTADISAGSSPLDIRRANFLSLCLQNPSTLVQINVKLSQNGQEIVTAADFDAVEDKALLQHLYEHLNDKAVVTVDELCDSLDELLLVRVQSLLTIPSALDVKLDRLADTLVLSVLDWRLEKIKTLLSKVRRLFREAQDDNDLQSLEVYRAQLRSLPGSVLKINRARDAMTAIGRRRKEDASMSR